MQTGLTGIPVLAKGFIFAYPQDHGANYDRFINRCFRGLRCFWLWPRMPDRERLHRRSISAYSYVQRHKMIQIVAIEHEKIDQIWPRIKDHIQMALDHSKGELSINTLKKRLDENRSLLLLASDGADILASIVCELVDTDSGRVCNIVTAGGEKADTWLDEWYNQIVPIAKDQGCVRISLNGRKGWEKKLKKYGFDYAYTTLHREL